MSRTLAVVGVVCLSASAHASFTATHVDPNDSAGWVPVHFLDGGVDPGPWTFLSITDSSMHALSESGNTIWLPRQDPGDGVTITTNVAVSLGNIAGHPERRISFGFVDDEQWLSPDVTVTVNSFVPPFVNLTIESQVRGSRDFAAVSILPEPSGVALAILGAALCWRRRHPSPSGY